MSYRGYNESFEGDVLNPLWFPHTTPAVRDYLLARGIDPFTKPASRPRKVFDPYEHKPLSSQMPQTLKEHLRTPSAKNSSSWTTASHSSTSLSAPNSTAAENMSMGAARAFVGLLSTNEPSSFPFHHSDDYVFVIVFFTFQADRSRIWRGSNDLQLLLLMFVYSLSKCHVVIFLRRQEHRHIQASFRCANIYREELVDLDAGFAFLKKYRATLFDSFVEFISCKGIVMQVTGSLSNGQPCIRVFRFVKFAIPVNGYLLGDLPCLKPTFPISTLQGLP